MKSLSDALANTSENKKNSTTLTEAVEVEKTTSRKIFMVNLDIRLKVGIFLARQKM